MARHEDEIDINGLYSSAVTGWEDTKPKNNRTVKKEARPSANQYYRRDYTREVFGPAPVESRKPQKPKNHYTIAIQFPSLGLGSLKNWVKNHKSAVTKTVVFLLVIALFIVGFNVYVRYKNNQNDKPAGSLAPEKVYTPQSLPDGYSVGSAAQTLENGAVLYTIYDDKGRNITVTQHSKPQEFNEELLVNAAKFPTANGTGYVMETSDRTTGYLFTEKSWVLLNSTDGISADEMREVIYSFK